MYWKAPITTTFGTSSWNKLLIDLRRVLRNWALLAYKGLCVTSQASNDVESSDISPVSEMTEKATNEQTGKCAKQRWTSQFSLSRGMVHVFLEWLREGTGNGEKERTTGRESLGLGLASGKMESRAWPAPFCDSRPLHPAEQIISPWFPSWSKPFSSSCSEFRNRTIRQGKKFTGSSPRS